MFTVLGTQGVVLLKLCLCQCRRAGGAYKAPATVDASLLQQLAEAAVSDPAVRRRTLLSPSRQAPPRRHRAVLASARQAAVDAPVPAYVRSSVALGTAAAEDSRAGHLSASSLIGTQPRARDLAPFFAAAAELQRQEQPRRPEPAAQRGWQPASARTGRYFGAASAGAAPAAQQPATAGGAAADLAVEEVAAEADCIAAPDAGARPRRGGDGDDDAAIARLRVGVSRGGDSGLLCWRLLLELLSRRAVAAPSPSEFYRRWQWHRRCSPGIKQLRSSKSR